ncbi:hypothetical protein FoTM2_017001 [Fusarium oxysporum f. sp. vasinfectum]|uniref:DUF7053 domain-containing protein n=1 Tax=Fusarium oxysporum f. sp. vasinfectum 25433 TaxID=1089449 RepID=X0KJT0_FUSOX|nr:hypothetical protein FOTG_17692 [Fusarium oxysporum f. sp. vasinfectum 25433]KAJ4127298.1 hypothetical protein NW765_017250 [Fusarium oxysporum]KAJ4261404.1 hypothetical protein NW764_016249 [Fusarium oxysporum]KAK2923477.1 hypothetical protein FoTM2_017001 [Fusarium oxysporum f. sp. vasinfectum]
MRSKHRILDTAPIPSHLSWEIVLAHIHTYTPLLKHNAVFVSFSETTPDFGVVQSEPFFGPPNNSVQSFLCFQRLELAPGLRQDEEWPITFLRIKNGIRARVDARAGVTVWIECLVRRRPNPGTLSTSSTPNTPDSFTDEWELYEEVVVESNTLLMPFVSRMTDLAHPGICQRIMNDILSNYWVKVRKA